MLHEFQVTDEEWGGGTSVGSDLDPVSSVDGRRCVFCLDDDHARVGGGAFGSCRFSEGQEMVPWCVGNGVQQSGVWQFVSMTRHFPRVQSAIYAHWIA